MPERKVRAKQARQLALNTRTNGIGPVRPVSARQAEAARPFAIRSARLMNDDYCEDVMILDLGGVSPVCDYFVIGTGTSDRQMRAVADHIKEMGRQQGETPYGVAGYEEGSWIILDYVDVVIHLFEEEKRSYYDLESLWGDCPRVDWREAQ